MSKNNTTNLLLFLILIVLTGVLFQGKIKAYFKAQEILKRANIYNVPDVAAKCYKSIISDEDIVPTDACMRETKSYRESEQRWKSLINENRNLSCKDFVDSRDANNFYSYVSGELSGGFYKYREAVDGQEPDTETFSFMSTTAFDGKCRYDPYGLDTNGDCNACDNYFQ